METIKNHVKSLKNEIKIHEAIKYEQIIGIYTIMNDHTIHPYVKHVMINSRKVIKLQQQQLIKQKLDLIKLITSP